MEEKFLESILITLPVKKASVLGKKKNVFQKWPKRS